MTIYSYPLEINCSLSKNDNHKETKPLMTLVSQKPRHKMTNILHWPHLETNPDQLTTSNDDSGTGVSSSVRTTATEVSRNCPHNYWKMILDHLLMILNYS